MNQPHDDPINALCELAEASTDRFQATELNTKYGSALLTLANLGVIADGAPLNILACRACDEDHSAPVEYDAATGRNWHFCPVAGPVTIDDAHLATIRFNAVRLVEQLVKAFPISTPVRQRELVRHQVWHLGNARCGETQVTVIFARRVSNQAALERLASVLVPVRPAGKGLVVTTSPHAAHHVKLPNGYEFLDLREIAREGQGQVTLDNARLGSWLRTMPATSGKGATSRSGRPSFGARVTEIYHERRAAEQPVVNNSVEAREILKTLAKRIPDQTLPKLPSVRRHVANLRER